jgi:hypothetical protein
MRILFDRMKHNPNLVGNQQLVSLVIETLRSEAKKPPEDPMLALMRSLTGGGPGGGNRPSDEKSSRENDGILQGVQSVVNGIAGAGEPPRTGTEGS